MSGSRYNKGKPGLNLLPLDALREICKVYDFGASKYAPWNWAKGLSWSETQASLMRHLTDWSLGIDKDEESGLYHDIHIAWNAITLVAMRLRGIGKDDRYKLNTVSDDVPRHTIEGNISDPIVPVTTTYDPTTLGSLVDNVANMMGPNNDSPDAWRRAVAICDPVTGDIKGWIGNP